MRSHWFEHVRKTRKKMTRASKGDITHQAAMREASTSWPAEKVKLVKKLKRAENKENKEKRELNK